MNNIVADANREMIHDLRMRSSPIRRGTTGRSKLKLIHIQYHHAYSSADSIIGGCLQGNRFREARIPCWQVASVRPMLVILFIYMQDRLFGGTTDSWHIK